MNDIHSVTFQKLLQFDPLPFFNWMKESILKIKYNIPSFPVIEHLRQTNRHDTTIQNVSLSLGIAIIPAEQHHSGDRRFHTRVTQAWNSSTLSRVLCMTNIYMYIYYPYIVESVTASRNTSVTHDYTWTGLPIDS